MLEHEDWRHTYVAYARHCVGVAVALFLYSTLGNGVDAVPRWLGALLFVYGVAAIVAGVGALYFTKSQTGKAFQTFRNMAWILTGALFLSLVAPLFAIKSDALAKGSDDSRGQANATNTRVASLQPVASCTATQVLRGDLLIVTCTNDAKPFTLRLNLVDAPRLEPAQPYGLEATAETTLRCLGKQAVVSRTGADRYGRTLGSITCEGHDLQMLLVAGGYAWISPETEKNREQQLLAKIMSNARAMHVGLWAEPNPIAPSVWALSAPVGTLHDVLSETELGASSSARDRAVEAKSSDKEGIKGDLRLER